MAIPTTAYEILQSTTDDATLATLIAERDGGRIDLAARALSPYALRGEGPRPALETLLDAPALARFEAAERDLLSGRPVEDAAALRLIDLVYAADAREILATTGAKGLGLARSRGLALLVGLSPEALWEAARAAGKVERDDETGDHLTADWLLNLVKGRAVNLTVGQ